VQVFELSRVAGSFIGTTVLSLGEAAEENEKRKITTEDTEEEKAKLVWGIG
jgi:hypothetical protein